MTGSPAAGPGAPVEIVPMPALGATELATVEALARLCEQREGLKLKLSWDLMRDRPGDQTDDFLAYVGGALVGYLSLDGYGDEFECTGMVHPDHRRRGLFSRLLDLARGECRARAARQLLLVCERASTSGQAFAVAAGTHYRFSEYHLELDATRRPAVPSRRPELRVARSTDATRLIDVQARSFAEPEEAARAYVSRDLAEPSSQTYLATLAGEPIGKLGAVFEESGVYLRGFGVVPELRGRGYGRQILATAIDLLADEGHHRFALDVVCENSNALGLYQSCGFRETNHYDYFAVDLSAPSATASGAGASGVQIKA